MAVRGAYGMTWLLRAVLAVAAGLLVAVLTSLWSAPSASAAPGGDATPTTGAVTLGTDGGALPVADQGASVSEHRTPDAAPFLAPVAESVPAAEPMIVASVVEPETVVPVVDPVTEVAVPPVDATADPVVPVVDPVTVAVVPPVDAVPDPAVVPVAEAAAPPVETVLDPAVEAVVTHVPGALGEVAPELSPSSPPVPNLHEPGATPQAPHRGSLGPTAGPVPSVERPVPADGTAAAPCPPVTAPTVPTTGPASPGIPWTDPDDGDLPPAPVPAAASPPTPEHLRSLTRGDPRPSGGPMTDLPLESDSAPRGARTAVDGDLPAGLEPPQLRVLSTRAGPGPTSVVAPQIEILDSPA